MEYYELFKQIEIITHYLQNYSNFKILSLSTFYNNSCPCIINPKVDSCVDIIKSSLFHYSRAIAKSIQNNIDLRNQLSICDCSLYKKAKADQWLTYLTKPVEQLIYFAYCPREEHPILVYNNIIPKFQCWSCARRSYTSYGVSTLGIFSYPILNQ